MRISSKRIRYSGLYVLIGILFGLAIGLGLSFYNNWDKQPVIFHYADNYSGKLSGDIYDKNVYTIIDENGNYYIVPKDTYHHVDKGDKLDSIVK